MLEHVKQTEKIPCPLCGTFDDVVLATRGEPDIPLRNVICKHCTLIRITPRASSEDYAEFYKKDFFAYLNPHNRPAYVEEMEKTTKDSETTVTKRLILFFKDYVPKGGRVLDVGAGFGAVLYLLKKEKGVETVGLEPDPGSRQIAKEKIGMVLEDDVVEHYLEQPHGTFDLIVLNQTFEHLLAPLEVLKKLAACLRPEGVIYIGVPSTCNPGVPMTNFYQFAHTFNYTPHAMDLFAKKAGLKIIQIKDPMNAALEVLLARKDSSYPEAPERDRNFGSNWKSVRAVLRRKRRHNLVRGAIKKALGAVIGQQSTQRVRSVIDKLLRYQY